MYYEYTKFLSDGVAVNIVTRWSYYRL